MSELYSITVLERPNPMKAVFGVQVVHPDSMVVYNTPGFALMLLQECNSANNKLAEEVDFDTVLDAKWLKQYARGFVKSVKVLSLENKPPKAAELDYEHAYWTDAGKWLRGTIEVRVTHPAWISHVKEGMSWGSAAFDPHSSYDYCDAIAPSAPAQKTDLDADYKNSPGFMPITKYFREETYGFPDVVWVTKYGESAYKPLEKVEKKDITEELLEEWAGRPVFLKGGWTDGIGTLVSKESFLTVSSGSIGTAGISASSLEWIAPAAFDKGKKRLNDPINYAFLFSMADPVVTEVEVDGRTATLKMYVFDARKRIEHKSATDTLDLIARPFMDSFGEFGDATCKLGRFLDQQMEASEVDFSSQLFQQLANGMVKSCKIKQLKKATHPDFDTLEQSEVLEWMRKDPWSQWQVEVTVTDAAWLEHLTGSTPFMVGCSHNEPALEWTDEPLTWQAD